MYYTIMFMDSYLYVIKLYNGIYYKNNVNLS